MKNIWCSVNKENGVYLAERDKIYLDQFRRSAKYRNLIDNNTPKDIKLELSVLPLHFIGDIKNSRVLVLSLNPGFNEKYKEFYEKNRATYEKTIEDNLTFKNPRFFEFDFYKTEGEGYWKRLKPLFPEKYEKIKQIGGGANDAALDKYFKENISLVEFFPYHSKSYTDYYDKLGENDAKKKDYLPSQKYVFELIKKRINDKNDDVSIIISRATKKWFEAIHELKNYPNCYIVSNPQNPSFKSENIMQCQFNKGKEIMAKIQ